ncbi:hypothetical protein, partial [Asticcacaulis biprosthecium]|uniref:hypothetical protein n=1 Tax=Asticcacaulis biprosthecium TaxID=76891 RepID=UPI000590D421
MNIKFQSVLLVSALALSVGTVHGQTATTPNQSMPMTAPMKTSPAMPMAPGGMSDMKAHMGDMQKHMGEMAAKMQTMDAQMQSMTTTETSPAKRKKMMA